MAATLRSLFTGLAILAAVPHAQAQETEVDLELVLAVDVSRSMDRDEQDLQKAGYAAGLMHPEVIAAIRGGFLGRIAVTYVEWAGPGSQSVVMPWTQIDGLAAAETFVASLGTRPISYLHGTSISGALTFTADLFDDNGFRATRRVIDVSGDGPNNMGAPVLPVRDAVVARGITINGLPIMLHADRMGGFSIRELDIYYEDCVIGGPGAFLVTVETIDSIAEAIRRKLVLEIAGDFPPSRAIKGIVPVQFAERQPRIDCLIGEKLRRRWMDP